MQIPMFYSKATDTVHIAAGGEEKTAADDAERDLQLYGPEQALIWFLVEIGPLED